MILELIKLVYIMALFFAFVIINLWFIFTGIGSYLLNEFRDIIAKEIIGWKK